MAYLTPEERIAAAVGRGWRGLQNRFGAAREGSPQAGFNTAQAQPLPQPPAAGMPTERAKVSATGIATSLPKQDLATSHRGLRVAPTAPERAVPTQNFIMDKSTGNTVSMNPDGSMRWSDIAGETIARPEGGMVGDRGMQTSGMVRPTAQIDRYNAAQNVPRGQFFGVRPLPGAGGDNLADKSIGGLVVEGIRQKRAQVQAAQDLTARGQDAELMTAGMRQRTADEQNRILAERATSEMGLDRVQTKAAEQEMAQAEEVRGLIDQFDTAKDDTTRNRIKARINMLTGREEKQVQPHFTTEELQGLEGGSRAVAIVPDGAGGFRKVVPQESGATALPPVAERVEGQVYTLPQGKFKWVKGKWEAE